MPRPRGIRLTLLGGLTALAASAVIGAAPSIASAASIVEVTPLGGSAATINLHKLSGEEDVNDVAYAIRSKQATNTETVTGFSLERILVEGGVDVYTFNYVEIVRPGGGSVLLTRAQVRADGAFPDGQPVVLEDGASPAFLRPSAGPEDYNDDDRFTASPLRVIVHEGSLIELQAEASRSKAEVGERITFNATVTRQAAGTDPEISWSFGDGATKTGARVSHTFSEPGLWKVAVGATTPNDRTGGSALVEVRVGKSKAGGPDREGGGEDGGKGASDQGTSEGSGGTAGGSGDPDAAGTEPGTSAGNSDPADRTSEATPRPRQKEQERADRPGPPGETVSGELLSASDLAGAEVIPAATPSPSEQAPIATLRTGTPSEAGGFTVPGAALAGLGAFGLVGLGALAEIGVLAGAAAAMRRRFGGFDAIMRR